MKKIIYLILLAILGALLLVGCEAPSGNTTEKPEPNSMAIREQVKLAIIDLAERLGAPADEIKILRDESVTWRNGSLGCPRKGMMYTQALVPGTLIVLGHDGHEYEYHAGRDGEAAYCANPESPAEMNSGT